MKRLLLICTLLGNISNAQNLVPNGDFESHTACPTNFSQVNLATPWYQPYLPQSSTDYFNVCSTSSLVGVPINYFGDSQARSGGGYVGITTWTNFSDLREYLEVELTDTLMAGLEYCVWFYVSLPEHFIYACDGVGAYFSNSPVYYSSPSFGVLPLQPQVENPSGNIIADTTNWVLVKGSFIAAGGEKYLTIGNFKNDSVTNVLYFNPTASNGLSYFYIDDVNVVQGQCAVGLEEPEVKSEIKIYPNPVKDVCLITAKQFNNSTLSVYDITGRVVLTQAFSQQVKLNTAMFTPGVYIVEIKNKQGSSIKTKLIKE